jgi:hypothetical protein
MIDLRARNNSETEEDQWRRVAAERRQSDDVADEEVVAAAGLVAESLELLDGVEDSELVDDSPDDPLERLDDLLEPLRLSVL